MTIDSALPPTTHRRTVDNGNHTRSSWRMIMTMTVMMMKLLEFMCCLNLIYIPWTHINCLQQLSVEISMINWLKCWDFFPCAAATENLPARRQPDFMWWKWDFFYFCFIFVPCEAHHIPFVVRLSKRKKRENVLSILCAACRHLNSSSSAHFSKWMLSFVYFLHAIHYMHT